MRNGRSSQFAQSPQPARRAYTGFLGRQELWFSCVRRAESQLRHPSESRFRQLAASFNEHDLRNRQFRFLRWPGGQLRRALLSSSGFAVGISALDFQIGHGFEVGEHPCFSGLASESVCMILDGGYGHLEKPS